MMTLDEQLKLIAVVGFILTGIKTDNEQDEATIASMNLTLMAIFERLFGEELKNAPHPKAAEITKLLDDAQAVTKRLVDCETEEDVRDFEKSKLESDD